MGASGSVGDDAVGASGSVGDDDDLNGIVALPRLEPKIVEVAIVGLGQRV